MITQFRLKNFKGHLDTELALQQFTVLVGDNGSGKTSVLEALLIPEEIVEDLRANAKVDHARSDTKPTQAKLTGLELSERLRRGAHRVDLSAKGRMADGKPWEISAGLVPEPEGDWGLMFEGSVAGTAFRGTDFEHNADELYDWVMAFMGHVALYRVRADQVAASAYSDRTAVSVAEDGRQTAVALAALKLADDEAFDRIETAMRRIVPTLDRVLIRPTELLHPSNPNPVVGSKLYFDFRGAKNIPAHHASQGTLVVLALLTVLYSPDHPRVILLDDFDHSLHPRAQVELVRMIKELLILDEFRDTQIIATTHSPFVLDEVAPSDVIAFALRDDGTVAAKPLSEHPDAPKVNGALKAGELWTLDAERDWVR